MRVLILAVPIGAGHIKAAHAIKQAIERLEPCTQMRLEDCFNWFLPVYGFLYKKIYEFGQKYSTGLLKIFYDNTSNQTGDPQVMYNFHKLVSHHFPKLLKAFNPDYIISCHFSPAYAAALLKSKFNYRLGVVVTDYYIHPHWVNNEIDDYFIPHEALTEQLVNYGVKNKNIYPFGIPVNLTLETGIDKNAARIRFGLKSNRISAVVMGSKVFGGEWFEIVRQIVDFDYDLLVLCGENREAMKKIKNLKGKANLVTYGIVERVQELIAVCDILISKAGGITSTEATRAGPCLLFANSIPGLEDKNEEFFIKQNAALRIDKANAHSIIADLINSPGKMQKLRENLLKIAHRNSAQNIAQVILGEKF